MSINIFKIEMHKLNETDKKLTEVYNNNEFMEYDDVYYKTNNLLPTKVKFRFSNLFHIFDYRRYEKKYEYVNSRFSHIKIDVDKHNEKVLQKEIQNFKNVCGLIEGKELDEQQIDSIVRKNKNQLVIAGAGSGKTTTIVGKVKYLLITRQYCPDDILLLSFTNISAEEMKARIKKETNIDMDVFTFHKLGLEIIKDSIHKNIAIFNEDIFHVIQNIVNKKIEDHSFLNRLTYFISTARYERTDDFDFTSEKEYNEFLQTNRPTTLKGETVKSYGELEIANYLFRNNIDYKYEEKYKFNTMTDEFQQYKPDFYLPQHDIYIEYFGIDENNKVAPFLKGKDGKSASEIYNESINWKRETHKKNKTIMVETFYYEKKRGNLIKNLEISLKKYNVNIFPKTDEEIWKFITDNNRGIYDEICKTFATIINLIKSNDYSFEYLYLLNQVNKSKLNMLTLNLVQPIFESYQAILKENNSIDFNDMINMAIKFIINNDFLHKYKYVIVDEYQDMSNARFRLLKAMRNQNDYGLFCVGDDWQSIYGFNGSDIDLITNFEKYWGNTYTSFIENTYRFTSMLAILSGQFIMKNNHQIKKNINAKMSNDFAIKFINGYTEAKCIMFLEENLYKFEKGSTVFLIGRYSSDIDILNDNENFILQYNNIENVINVMYKKRLDLNIKFITAHKSKGLQADYAVIINNKNYGMGFPSKISDLPIIKILLGGGLEEYKYSEERRLFYVALTRSRKQTILLTLENNKSVFATEIEEEYRKLMKTNEELRKSVYTCPKCGGRLIKRKGPYGPFMGCSNYPNCNYTKNF